MSQTLEQLARAVEETVERRGHAVLCNAPEEGEPWPPFSYTVGLWKTHAHPELLVSALPTGVARLVLGRLAEAIQRGQSFADGLELEGLIPNCKLTFAELPHTHRFPVVFINQFYRVRVPTLQVFYTDDAGRWPWQREAMDPWRLASAYGDPAGSLRVH